MTTKTTLDQFGTLLQKQKYQIFTKEGLPGCKKAADTFAKKIKRLPILGSESFVKTVTEKYLAKNSYLPKPKQEASVTEIITIMHAVADYYAVEFETLKTINKIIGNKPRAIAIYLSCLLSNQAFWIIADQFTNISRHGVSKAFSRIKQKFKTNTLLVEDIKAIKDQLPVVV